MSKNNTIEDYKKAIKTKFEIEKTGSNADFCLNPTPANFKKWCSLVFESNYDKNDEEIFRKFFKWNEDEDKTQKLKTFDTDKFRPFQNFLTKNTEISQLESLNLIAVLVDFAPRPFSKFRTSFDENQDKLIAKNEYVEKVTPIYKEELLTLKKSGFQKYLLILLTIMISGWCIKASFFKEKNCMIWQKDHYQTIDCDQIKVGIMDSNPKAIDDVCLENLKKINPTNSTVFFKANKPCIWYGKSLEGKYEFFTYHGLHPETGKTLKPISRYIIDKYVVKNDN